MTLPTNNAEHEVAMHLALIRYVVRTLGRRLPEAQSREFIRDVTVQLEQTINEQVDLVVTARTRLPQIAAEGKR